jgi:hypothetical protein
MDRDAALRALDEAAKAAGAIRVEVDDEYLRLIARVESDPANQTGADKSWIVRAAAVPYPRPSHRR